LLVLFEEAETRGLVNGSENERLHFFAAAEHAAIIGSINPAGLFARLIRNRGWHFATLSDEDAARVRLKKRLHGDVVDAERERSSKCWDDAFEDATASLRKQPLAKMVGPGSPQDSTGNWRFGATASLERSVKS
jgi:hypothetical protein